MHRRGKLQAQLKAAKPMWIFELCPVGAHCMHTACHASPVKTSRLAKASDSLKGCRAILGWLHCRSLVRPSRPYGNCLCNGGLQCIVYILLVAHVLDVALFGEAPFFEGGQRLGLLGLGYVQQSFCLLQQEMACQQVF